MSVRTGCDDDAIDILKEDPPNVHLALKQQVLAFCFGVDFFFEFFVEPCRCSCSTAQI